jgi:hypothetical protein
MLQLRLLLHALFFTAALTARGATIKDHNTWDAVSISGPLGPAVDAQHPWSYGLDSQNKFANNSRKLAQSTWRASLGYLLDAHWSLMAGFGFTPTDTPLTSRPNRELRWTQQLGWTGHKGDLALGTRVRIEERFYNTGNDCGVRVRHQVRASHPVPGCHALSGVAWNEYFYNLNDTDYGTRHGYDQNRLFLGTGWKFNDLTRTEVGYLHNYVHRPGKDDRLNQTISVSVFVAYR